MFGVARLVSAGCLGDDPRLRRDAAVHDASFQDVSVLPDAMREDAKWRGVEAQSLPCHDPGYYSEFANRVATFLVSKTGQPGHGLDVDGDPSTCLPDSQNPCVDGIDNQFSTLYITCTPNNLHPDNINNLVFEPFLTIEGETRMVLLKIRQWMKTHYGRTRLIEIPKFPKIQDFCSRVSREEFRSSWFAFRREFYNRLSESIMVAELSVRMWEREEQR